MDISTARVASTIQRMTGRDQRCTNIFPIYVANADPPIMCAISVEFTVNRAPCKVVDHPAPGISTGRRAELWSIDAIQANGRSVDDNRVCISHMNLSQ